MELTNHSTLNPENNAGESETPKTQEQTPNQEIIQPEADKQISATSSATAEGNEEVVKASDYTQVAPEAEKPVEAEKLAEEKPAEAGVKPAEAEEKPAEPKPEPESRTNEEPEEIEEEEEDEESDEEDDTDYEALSREQLVELIEETVKNENVLEIKSKVGLIKSSFIKLTGKENEEKLSQSIDDKEEEQIETPVDELQERFDSALNIYKANKAKYNEQLEKQKLENLEKKKVILEQLKELISSEESLKKTYDDFRALQEKWKEASPIPHAEVQELWKNYHFLIEKFFDKVKISKELKDLDLKKNMEFKIELCEKAEELLLEKSITKSYNAMQKLFEEWKEIGQVPYDKSEELWERFRAATEQIRERRKNFVEERNKEREANYAAKLVLCEKAEEIVEKENKNHKEWTAATTELDELFKVWRTIGQVPDKVNVEVWSRFRAQMDKFFKNKKEFYSALKEEQLNNYNQKIELCIQAETFAESTDWRETTKELIRLQQEWKKIGPVPNKYSEKIWTRFRAACDKFFNNKQSFFKDQIESESANLEKKEEILQKLENYKIAEDKQESLNWFKDIQRQWVEIGFVPFKHKERLQKKYKELINKIYEELRVDFKELNNMQFQSRVDQISNQPESVKIINKEKSNIRFRINTLKEEILLWENNIGFFSKSKQSSLFKDEYEQKIKKAKEELKSLEDKIKMLSKAISKKSDNSETDTPETEEKTENKE